MIWDVIAVARLVIGVALTIVGGVAALLAPFGVFGFGTETLFLGGLIVAAVGLVIWQGDEWTREVF